MTMNSSRKMALAFMVGLVGGAHAIGTGETKVLSFFLVAMIPKGRTAAGQSC